MLIHWEYVAPTELVRVWRCYSINMTLLAELRFPQENAILVEILRFAQNDKC